MFPARRRAARLTVAGSAVPWEVASSLKMRERIIHSDAPGDILVFMPGRGEINGTIDALRGLKTHERVACIPLHGEIEPQEQDRAFAPNALRKLNVATNVADSSITIDGIRHVVDSGVARVVRYDAERGIGTLLLEPISRASSSPASRKSIGSNPLPPRPTVAVGSDGLGRPTHPPGWAVPRHGT